MSNFSCIGIIFLDKWIEAPDDPDDTDGGQRFENIVSVGAPARVIWVSNPVFKSKRDSTRDSPWSSRCSTEYCSMTRPQLFSCGSSYIRSTSRCDILRTVILFIRHQQGGTGVRRKRHVSAHCGRRHPWLITLLYTPPPYPNRRCAY